MIRVFICLVFLASLAAQTATAQEKPATAAQGIQIDQIAKILERKVAQRDALSQRIAGAGEGSFTDEREKLLELNEDIVSLRNSFELVVLNNLNVGALTDTTQQYDLRSELVEVIAPLLDSLKSVTQKPRQIAALRDSDAVLTARIKLAENALLAIAEARPTTSTDAAKQRLETLNDKWTGDKLEFEQELALVRTQLGKLTQETDTLFSNVGESVKQFFLGRGLTLVFAIGAALAAWVVAKLFWWLSNNFFIPKNVRRKSTWYRLLSYSYYLFTVLLAAIAVLLVLYVREDLLLLAIAFVAVAAVAISLRHMVPQYAKEVKLLLNIGPAREDELVVYNGIPWIINSLNIQTVLHNPAIHGIVRLPLDSVSELVSRPMKDTLLFPTQKSDFVILPDGTFGQIAQQTPNMVEVIVRGGMSVTYPTDQFYALNIINLSRNETFGVHVIFGFDYEQQGESLVEIPDAIKQGLATSLENAGYADEVKSVIVDLKEAGASSIDFLIFITLDSKLAANYFKIERLIQQTCVAVSNEKGWSIPFPQMTIHGASTANQRLSRDAPPA